MPDPSDTAPSLPDPDQWVELYGEDLYRYALLRVRDREVAVDLVQETLLAALRARHGFSGRSRPKTWLVGILRHKIVDHFRRYRRNPAAPGDAPGEDLFDRQGRWKNPPASGAADPGRALGRKEFWEQLHRCLGNLSPNLAAAFTLREMEGMTTDELCKVLDTTATNVWVILHRARIGLRHCLLEKGIVPESEGSL